jgi:outer membrane protein assembly factor BamB
MKINRIIILSVFLISASLVSACAGGARTANSWPGLTVDGDTAYLAYSYYIRAIDLSNGTERWHYPQEIDRSLTFYAAPTLDDNGHLVVGDYDKNLRLIEAENGQEVSGTGAWPFSEATLIYVGSSLALNNDIFAPNSDGNLYALTESAAPLWSPFKSSQGLWAKPASDGERLYLTSLDHYLYAIDIETGEEVWGVDLGGASVGTPALSEDGILYIGSFNSQMHAIDSRSGEILWKYATDGWVWSGPALDDNAVYFGDLEGVFYAVDRTSGDLLWQYQAGSPILSEPLVVDDTVYFTIESGSLVALLASDGSSRWTQSVADANLYSPPQVAGDLILIAPLGADAQLIAYNKDGVQQWSFVPSAES